MAVGVSSATAAVSKVCASMETAPVHNPTDSYVGTTTIPWISATLSNQKDVKLYPDFDAVDDAAIWIHPTDPSKSLIINSDKSRSGGYNLNNLDGSEQSWTPAGRLNNVDIRYNFPLGAEKVALVGFTDRVTLPYRLMFYKVNPATRTLTLVGTPAISTHQTIMPRGFAMYHSPNTGKYYAFVTDSGKTDQYLIDGSTGTVKLTLVRELQKTATSSEGLVADDEAGFLYLAEEKNTNDPPSTVGHIWKFLADPGASSVPTMVASTTNGGGVLTPDIKGLTMYYAAGGKGYLIAASQGKVPGQNYSSFGLFDRKTNAYVGSFAVTGSTCATDEVAGEDGIDVTNFNLGPAFPNGLFVTGDFENLAGGILTRQNNKVVPWERIAKSFTPNLLIDNTWDPRKIGGTGGPTDTTAPTVSITAPAANATLLGSGPFTANATDSGSGVDHVVFSVDGTVIATDTSAPYETTLNSALFANGQHTLGVSAVDGSGNVGTATTRTVTVANVSPPANGTRILSIPTAGSVLTLVAAAPGVSYRDPAYSKSRTRIAWTAPGGIMVANASGGGARLVAGSSGGSHPAWAGSDRTLVFTKSGGIYSLPLGGGVPKRIGNGNYPNTSPNGAKVAYQVRNAAGRYDVWLMNTSGTGKKNLTATATLSEMQPTWVSNTVVAYTRKVSAKWTIFRRPVIGGAATRVSSATLDCQQPAYSPSGATIACVRMATTNRIALIRATNGALIRHLAIPATKPTQPAWASNATVAYTTN